ncbi:MAG TPA: hypothetical protein VGK17_09710 [Propionicimonas sp.]
MKALFKEIRYGDLAAVRARLDVNPALVHATAKSPPKKDDGQSTLQVAIKSANFPIATLLLDRGADVNFMEQPAINTWRAPVLHDALRAAVLSARFWRNRALPGDEPRWEWCSTLERFNEACDVLVRILDLGASVHQVDSFGNSALGRACLDARQVLDSVIPPELDEDLERVFTLLLAAGADPDAVEPNRGQTLRALYGADPVAHFFG